MPESSPLSDAMQSVAHAERAVAAAKQHLGATAANPLITDLDAEGLGTRLKPDERTAVLVMVRGLEDGRGGEQRPPQQQQPQRA